MIIGDYIKYDGAYRFLSNSLPNIIVMVIFNGHVASNLNRKLS